MFGFAIASLVGDAGEVGAFDDATVGAALAVVSFVFEF